MRSLVGGESATSVTSSRSRSGRASRAVAATTPPTPRAGANVAEFGAALGTAAGIGRLVVPGAGLAGRRVRDRPGRPCPCAPLRRGRRGGGSRRRRLASSSSSAGVRLSDAAAVVPIQRAVPTAGLASCRSGMPKPTMTPRIASAIEQHEGARRREQVGQRARQDRVRCARRRRRGPGPRRRCPAYVMSRPRRVIAPAGPRARARAPFEPPAGEQQQERRDPAHRPEPRREDAASTSWSARPRPAASGR